MTNIFDELFQDYLTTRFTTQYLIYDIQWDRIIVQVFSQGMARSYYVFNEGLAGSIYDKEIEEFTNNYEYIGVL